MLKKYLKTAIILLGVGLIFAGIIFNPTFVGIYIKKKDIITEAFVGKIVFFQFILYSIGISTIIFALCLYFKRLGKYCLLPLILVYLILVQNLFISKIYPRNIFTNTNELSKMWNALLGKEIFLSDFKPESSLIVERKNVLKAKFPVIDIHFHFASMKDMKRDELVQAMNSLGIEKIINLDGWEHEYEKYKREFVDVYPDRFIMFAVVNWFANRDETFLKDQINYLEKTVANGAKGLKIPKSFGLKAKDKFGKLLEIDDLKWEPIWQKVEEMKIPVLMHTADPTPFFDEVNRFNERFDELGMFPEWNYYGAEYPKKEKFLEQRENLLKRHPNIVFIGAHIGMNADNLKYAAGLLDKYSNYYVDIAAVLNDLGRQPFTARKFFIKYQDRILFGTDGGYYLGTKEWPAQKYYSTYFEFLETSNEYFPYPIWDVQKQGRWNIYGLSLPDEVLEKVYYKNAKKLLSLK
jgi:uncharacterized protein